MIAGRYRFHGYGGLNYVYKKGRTVRVGVLSVRSCPNTRRKNSRIAVVVSKKVTKSAVERNRIRRRIYEVVRYLIPDITSPHDIVITVYDKQILRDSHDELTSVVIQLLTKAKIISNP